MLKLGYRDKLLTTRTRFWIGIEIVLITGIILALSFYFDPQDPMMLEAPFPWIWFAPVLIALRYGTLAGAGSIVIIFAALFSFEPRALLISTHYRVYMLGGVLLMVVCGEFYNAWDDSKRRYSQLNEYIRKRLDGLNRAYYIIRLSHDRLEQSLISRPVTLRSAVGELRKLLVDVQGNLSSDIASRFLHILEQYCSLDRAALYLAQKGKLDANPIASVGGKLPLDLDDVLVKKSLSSSGVHYFGVNQIEEKEQSKYLVVTTFRDEDDSVLGLLAIEKMPFWALNDEILQSLLVLVSYMSESIWSTQSAKETLKIYSDCTLQFSLELNNLLSLKKQLNVDSALVAFAINHTDRYENILLGIQNRQRGLDVGWRYKGENQDILFVILPFSSATAVEGFRNRFSGYLKEEFGVILGGEEVYLRYLQLSSEPALQVIKKLLGYVDAR